MTPETARALLEHFLPQLYEEATITAQILQAVPPDQSAFRPHQDARSAAQIANHLVESERYFLGLILTGELPADEPAEIPPPVSESLRYFTGECATWYQRLRDVSGEHLARPLAIEEWTWPAVAFLQLMIKHGVHHRGQLSTYLRPMGARVPSIYGPSADDGQAVTHSAA